MLLLLFFFFLSLGMSKDFMQAVNPEVHSQSLSHYAPLLLKRINFSSTANIQSTTQLSCVYTQINIFLFLFF